jgi:ABC-type polysaccharide/polyol phosphate transport system ATPase subunit/ABC-type polysaccharide/polyol phosphate export permease
MPPPSQAPPPPGATELAIRLLGVTKFFRVLAEPAGSVRERVLHPRQRNRGSLLPSLNDISLEIQRGSCVGIVGRNGSGKSTLLRCIAGIYVPDSGEVSVAGRLAPFIELGVGFDPAISARENVITSGILFGLRTRDVRARVDEIFRYAELERFTAVKLKNYSTGMAARLAFSVTTHIDADVLLFDEVIATGDLAFQRRCFERFAQLRAEGRTLVLVTHDMDAVQSLCDRVLLLDEGSIVWDGDPAEAVDRYDAINLGPGEAAQAQVGRRRGQRSLGERWAAPAQHPTGRPVIRETRGGWRRLAVVAGRLAVVEYRLKYTDAALGYAWALMRPLATFAVLDLVFTRVAHFDAGVPHYAVYLLAALVLWTFFLDATDTSVFALVNNGELLRKLPLPRSALPLAVVMRALLDLGMNLIAVSVFVVASGISPSLRWIELPFLVLFLAGVATGLALLLSSLYVRLRDVDQLWSVLGQMLFYASPILYVASALPHAIVRPLVLLNPLAAVFTQMRFALLGGGAPSAATVAGGTFWLLIPCGVGCATVAGGMIAFRRIAPRAAEQL